MRSETVAATCEHRESSADAPSNFRRLRSGCTVCALTIALETVVEASTARSGLTLVNSSSRRQRECRYRGDDVRREPEQLVSHSRNIMRCSAVLSGKE